MRSILLSCSCLAIVLGVAAGCARPRLAARPLAPHEEHWAAFIGDSYENWQPPYLSPVRTGEQRNEAVRRFAPGPEGPAAVEPPRDVAAPPVSYREIELIPVDAPRTLSTPPVTTYTVKRGDTLSGIAKTFYDDPLRWRRILDHNRDTLTSPEALKPGMVLEIPPPQP